MTKRQYRRQRDSTEDKETVQKTKRHYRRQRDTTEDKETVQKTKRQYRRQSDSTEDKETLQKTKKTRLITGNRDKVRPLGGDQQVICSVPVGSTPTHQMAP